MITVLYVKGYYLNPSYSVLYEEFEGRTCENLRVINVNETTISDIKKAFSQSSCVAMSDMVFALASKEYWEIAGWYFVNPREKVFYELIWESFLKVSCAKLMITFHFDLHAKENIFPLDPSWKNHIDAIAWIYEKRPVSIQDAPCAYLENWIKYFDEPPVNWEKIINLFPVRIEIPFSLSSSELQYASNDTLWDVCVPGANYTTRKIAKKQIEKENLSIAPYQRKVNSVVKLLYDLNRMLPARLRPYTLRRIIPFAQKKQRHIVSRSRAAFVCGSIYRYPVRKFFEIPAARSAMMAYPCVGFEDYGFKDGENVVVALPEDAGRAANRLINNTPLREKLTVNAWEMVRRLHSAEKRVSDLVECMRHLEKGKLRGAQFINGQYEIY